MELPKGQTERPPREITGEIVYLDRARQFGDYPHQYLDLGELAIENYELRADYYKDKGMTPAILAEYERHDNHLTAAEASCMALANELLALKEEGSSWSFIDMVVTKPADEVRDMLVAAGLGRALAADDEQLAIESDGSHYPILDVKKADLELDGVGLRVWGWDDPKVVFTNSADEKFDPSKHILKYPHDEKSMLRQIQIGFTYRTPEGSSVIESLSLWLRSEGMATINREIWMPEYAETGYEGHGFAELEDCTEADVLAFGTIAATIVGDEPETIQMQQNRVIRELCEGAASLEGRTAVQRLVDASWPAQAAYVLSMYMKTNGMTLEAALRDEATVDEATAAIDEVIASWKKQS